MRIVWMGLLLGAAMCEQGPGPAKNTDVTTPTNVDPSTPQGMDCHEVMAVPDPGQGGLPECVVEELTCGDVVYATNLGGTEFYDRDYWLAAQSMGALATESPDVLDGPERVYAIYGQPPDTEITVTVSSCIQLWPSYIRHGDISTIWCDEPSPQGLGGHFTGEWQDKTTTLLNRSASEYNWEIVVDSWNGQTGNFRIEVECF